MGDPAGLHFRRSRTGHDRKAAAINSSLDIKEVLHNLTTGISAALAMKGAAIRLLDKEKEALKLVASHGLAHQGGPAIQNASMYMELEEDKKSLEQDIWSHRAWF